MEGTGSPLPLRGPVEREMHSRDREILSTGQEREREEWRGGRKRVNYYENTSSSLPPSAFEKVVHYRGQEFLCPLIDTAGQDEYFLLPQNYTVGIHGYVMVYSVANEEVRESCWFVMSTHSYYRTPSSFDVVKVIHDN